MSERFIRNRRDQRTLGPQIEVSRPMRPPSLSGGSQTSTDLPTPGSIVRCRNRDWVLLPSDSSEVQLLRPLASAMDQVVAIHRQLSNLIGSAFPEERIRPAQFPLPSAADIS